MIEANTGCRAYLAAGASSASRAEARRASTRTRSGNRAALVGEGPLDPSDQPPLLLEPLLQPLPMQLEEPPHEERIVRCEDGADLLRVHPLRPQDPPRRRRGDRHLLRSFGVSIHPSPAAKSRSPNGAPITVMMSIMPVMNRIEPNTTPLRLGRSGPTQS